MTVPNWFWLALLAAVFLAGFYLIACGIAEDMQAGRHPTVRF